MFARQIGIDLGTTNVLVYLRGRGIVVNEPSVVAVSPGDRRVEAVGDEALQMLGRSAESLEIVRPLRHGVIADYFVTEAMLRYFIEKVCGRFRLLKPVVMMAVPAGATGVELRAVDEAALAAGARAPVYSIQEPLAAAIGAGLPISAPSGNLIVDIGGGTTEVAVISLNDVVVIHAERIGGAQLDEDIATYVRRRHNLLVGDRTTEEAKIAVGSALPLQVTQRFDIRGRDVVSGLPRTATISSEEITEAMRETLMQIIAAIKTVLERTPPELAADIVDKGIVLTGGGALLRQLDRFVTFHTGVPCHVAEQPLDCVALGTGLALEHLDVLRNRTSPGA